MSGTVDSQRPRMLIVEEERVAAADLHSTLHSLGYNVVATVDSGRKAIRQIEQVRPDLVLMDIQLKGSMDGMTAAEEIWRRWSIPVVLVTDRANAEALARVKAVAPYGYVVKPFCSKDLHATIRVALNQHKLTEEIFTGHIWLLMTLGSLSDGFIATDEEGCVRYMNPAAEEFTGQKLADVHGEPIEKVYPLTGIDGTPLQNYQLRRALLAVAPIPKERFLLGHSSGRKIPIEDAAVPIVNGGRVIGAVTVFTDITERLRRERDQELERDRLEEEISVVTEALGQTRGELQALSGHLMATQEEERRRIERELHDDFGQRTAALAWQLEQLSSLVAFEGPAQLLWQAIRSQTMELSERLRETSHRLYPSVLADLGLAVGLRQLVESFREGGIEVSLQASLPLAEISLEVSTALYRITQEALRNVSKHSGGAPARVTLKESDSVLQLIIEDAGPGFDLAAARMRGGLGLVSMRERARMAGGTLLVRMAPGEGTQIVVHVPLNHPST